MNESIGAKLRQAREQRHLTIQQVSDTTKVRPHYLQALENDDLSAVSSAAQARGFLRIYADFLGLNTEDLMLVKRSDESVPATQIPGSLPGHSSAAGQETKLKNKTERPGILAKFFYRFTHRPEGKTVTEHTTETVALVENQVTPEPIPFVPARVTEELPATPVSPVEEAVVELKAVQTHSTPSFESTPTVKVLKKTGARSRRSSTGIDKKNVVKKKGNV